MSQFTRVGTKTTQITTEVSHLILGKAFAPILNKWPVEIVNMLRNKVASAQVILL